MSFYRVCVIRGPDALVQMLVVSFMMSSLDTSAELGEVTLRHNLWLETISGSGVALHLVEAWKVGRGLGAFVTSRLLLPLGFVLCLSASGT